MENCHTLPTPIAPTGLQQIALVGSPNVGKSMLFHRLTGQYVIVANYPGTTVELSQGKSAALQNAVIVDTPGIVSFPARSEDECVTARVLLERDLDAVIQVGDAKNMLRSLNLTVQLVEMGLPMTLALNMMDEARARGMEISASQIANRFGIGVVETVATRGKGTNELLQAVKNARQSEFHIDYGASVETALETILPMLPAARVHPRALALMWLSNDGAAQSWLQEHCTPQTLIALIRVRSELAASLAEDPANVIAAVRRKVVEDLVTSSVQAVVNDRLGFSAWLSSISTHPVWGIPFAAAILAGMYWFVGVFGAGTLVGFLEETLFAGIINPWLTGLAARWIQSPFIYGILFGEYGQWTMGATYAFGLLLPIVITFFISFGILEDSGYLPRVAVLTNRLFRSIGLNGQAILPMILGLGCVTMATMTTRILTSKRDRILVTFLLALAVPCSAQLGVVLGMLAHISASAAIIWGGIVMAIMLLVGWLSSRLLPGERSPLVVELPPLRMPVLSNVIIKTAARVEWYIKEAVPLFMLGALILFLLDYFALLPLLIQATEPVITGWLGLPPEAASSFLLGLMRRDFAATGLFAMQSDGLLTPIQALVSIVTITLFVPCIASIFMMIKERGWKIGLGMTIFIFPFAFLVGGLLLRLLTLLGWGGV